MTTIIENYVREKAASKNEDNKKYSNIENSKPCSFCGHNELVQKFRNVVGEISGSVCGNFSLFGGSISGSIDGSTRTLPILSCRKCGNEREIITWKYTSSQKVFWDDMFNFYFGITEDKSRPIPDIYLLHPLETRQYMEKNKNFEFSFYNELPLWHTETWARAGFKIEKVIKKFLFFKREVFPTWEDLYKKV